MILAFVIAGAIALRLLYAVLTENDTDNQANPGQKPRRRRELEGLETFLYNLEKTGTGTIGNVLCLTSSVSLTPELITKTLLTLVHRQPSLRAKVIVVDGGLKKYFELAKISDIAIPLTSVPLSADHWKRAWEERRYVHTFEENALLWSASVLREEFDADSGTYRNTLIFALHHAICDGVSSSVFTKQFVEALNQVVENTGENSAQGFSNAASRTSECETTTSEHRPTSSEHGPKSSENRPTSSEHRPTSSEHRPTSSEHRPTVSEHRPTIPEPRPISSEHRPTNSEQRPMTSAERPTTSEFQPNLSEHQPTTVPNSLPFAPGGSSLLHHKVGFSVWQKAFGLPQLFGALTKMAIRWQAKWRKPNPLVEAYIRASAKDCSPTDDLQTIVTKELSVSKTTDLVRAARNHDTTVNSILTMAGHVVLCEILQGGVPLLSAPPPIEMIIAVNIRKNCSPRPPDEYIGQYAVGHFQSLPFVEGQDGDILKLAKDFNTEFKKKIASEKHLLVHRVFESIGGDAFSKMAETSPTRAINPQALTNLGRQALQSGPHFQASNVFFLVSMRPTPHLDTTMFCNSVLTLNGKLQWVTGYDHTLVGRKQAEEYVSRIFEKIDNFL